MREPGTDKVTSATRAFELEDAQMFRGAGRGPTPLRSLKHLLTLKFIALHGEVGFAI